ncbi:MAG: tetratricopeptide repeat protein [Muribaculaceae bacterium]|nr:tetratricopeptide repeat protein [Muribaculaceae bacterium]MBR1475452.1 tetratricopeptide repeat protein [Muribaculaceae bacterium]
MIKRLFIILAMLLTLNAGAWAQQQQPTTVKKERKHIRTGNSLFHDKRYAEAEVEYRKALQVAPQSAIAQFNLATSLLMQGGGAAANDDKNNPVKQAADILTDLAKHAPTKQLRSKANYDLGNLAYASQQYDQAVQLYKQALRDDPSDDQARYNLRMAQLKLKNQQNKNQNQNQDKQKQDQDKQKQDQDKQKQDQDKQKQDQDKQKQDQDKQKQDQQQQQQGGMSQQNAEQVLKTMQDQENATQQRINAARAQQERRERARTNRKW